MSPASVTLWWGKFTDGASALSTWLISVVPCCCICSDVNTSTGTASSSDAACRARNECVPAGTPRISYSPLSLVVARAPIASMLTLTRASGAPVVSATRPRTVPPCAASRPEVAISIRTAQAMTPTTRRIGAPCCSEGERQPRIRTPPDIPQGQVGVKEDGAAQKKPPSAGTLGGANTRMRRDSITEPERDPRGARLVGQEAHAGAGSPLLVQ